MSSVISWTCSAVSDETPADDGLESTPEKASELETPPHRRLEAAPNASGSTPSSAAVS